MNSCNAPRDWNIGIAGYGKGGFGSIRYETKETCKRTLIIFIIIRSNMDWFSSLMIGPGQRTTNGLNPDIMEG